MVTSKVGEVQRHSGVVLASICAIAHTGVHWASPTPTPTPTQPRTQALKHELPPILSHINLPREVSALARTHGLHFWFKDHTCLFRPSFNSHPGRLVSAKEAAPPPTRRCLRLCVACALQTIFFLPTLLSPMGLEGGAAVRAFIFSVAKTSQQKLVN